MQPVRSGGGWQAIGYTLAKAREVGPLRLWRAMRSRNACKTCALGMGGQAGGMVNEAGHFPEVCKKSLQAMVADMQGGITPEFFRTWSIEQLRRFTPRDLESCGRLTQPVVLRRGENHYLTIGWEEALARIAEKLRAVPPDETFWYFSGRSSNEAAFLMQLFARRYGTNNVSNCSYYCHQASGVALGQSLGTGTATIVLEDLERSDLVFLIGGNPASNHPRMMRSLMTVRRRGGDVIVINPVVEPGLVNFSVPSDWRSLLFGSPIASQYVQPHIGGDLALLTGLAKRTLELGAADERFLREHCDGWEALGERLRGVSWDEIVAKSGVAREVVDRVAERYARSPSTVFAWTMGITHHAHGVESIQAIANLALMRGMVGRPHAGLLPIRGHSNVQGIGSVGVVPKLKDTIRERMERHFNIQLPTSPGMDTTASLEAAHAGRLRVGVCVGGNLFGAAPDANFATEAFRALDLAVHFNTTLNTGHAYGLAAETIVLPVLARDEEPQATTQESMFNFLRMSDGGPRRHEGPRSEVEIFTELAWQVLGPEDQIDWGSLSDHGRIRQAIAEVIPGWGALAEMDRTRQEFQIAGRTFHEPRFPRSNGRAQLFCHALPPLAGLESAAEGSAGNGAVHALGAEPLRLMTVRSEGQFNTVVYEEYDLYRGQDRRDVILLHPDDIGRRHLQSDQPVTVRSRTGKIERVLVRPFAGIKPGNALMYFPEANVLVPREVDPLSRTPAYKNVLVTVMAGAVPANSAGNAATAGAAAFVSSAALLAETESVQPAYRGAASRPGEAVRHKRPQPC